MPRLTATPWSQCRQTTDFVGKYYQLTSARRDPKEIMLSSHVRLGRGGEIGTAADSAATLGELGLDLAIVILPPPHHPAVLAPLADALAQLR